MIELGLNTSIRHMDMAVCNGKIYITGELGGDHSTDSKWVTWIGDEMQNYGGPAIIENEGAIYSIRRFRTGNDGFTAYGQFIPLSGNGSGIAVKNGSVYVVGYYWKDGKRIPCYWIDGERKNFLVYDNAFDGSAWDIAVLSDGCVCVIGATKFGPTLWTEVSFQTCLGDAERYNKICAFEDKIYILGTCKRGALKIPCYWIMVKKDTGGLIVEKQVMIPGARSVTDMVVTRE